MKNKKVSDANIEFLRKSSLYLAYQKYDLDFKEFKKFLRKKSGGLVDFNYEKEYEKYLEKHENLQ